MLHSFHNSANLQALLTGKYYGVPTLRSMLLQTYYTSFRGMPLQIAKPPSHRRFYYYRAQQTLAEGESQLQMSLAFSFSSPS